MVISQIWISFLSSLLVVSILLSSVPLFLYVGRFFSLYPFSIVKDLSSDSLFGWTHCGFVGLHFLLETVIKPSLPDIDGFFRSGSQKVITFFAKLCHIGGRVQCELELTFLSVPDLNLTVFWRTHQMSSMRMEINTLHCPLMTFIYLNNLPGPNIIKLDFLIMRARSSDIPQRVKFGLMNDPCMFLVLLDHFLGLDVPDVDHSIIAGN